MTNLQPDMHSNNKNGETKNSEEVLYFILIYTKEAKTLWMFPDKSRFDLSNPDLKYCTGTE